MPKGRDTRICSAERPKPELTICWPCETCLVLPETKSAFLKNVVV